MLTRTRWKTTRDAVTQNSDLMNKTANVITKETKCADRKNLVRQLLYFVKQSHNDKDSRVQRYTKLIKVFDDRCQTKLLQVLQECVEFCRSYFEEIMEGGIPYTPNLIENNKAHNIEELIKVIKKYLRVLKSLVEEDGELSAELQLEKIDDMINIDNLAANFNVTTQTPAEYVNEFLHTIQSRLQNPIVRSWLMERLPEIDIEDIHLEEMDLEE